MKSTKISKSTAEPPPAQLQSSDPEKLRREMQSVQLAIARRAYELFDLALLVRTEEAGSFQTLIIPRPGL